MKTIEFNKNWKLVNLEYWDNQGYFDLECGRFGKMLFAFDIRFNVDSQFQFNSVDVILDKYDWEEIGKYTKGFLSKKNTKLICEKIEGIISENPEAWGFDSEEFENNAYWSYQSEREVAYYDERC